MARILITRSSHQASELADQLRSAGLEPVMIPTIEIVPPSSFVILDTALAHLDTFHWLLFTSANAVEAFAKRLPPPQWLLPASCRIAAIGPATSRALESIGLAPTLMPPQAVAESLAEALLPHARQPDGTPTRFLLIRAEQARDHLPDTLRSAGADVTIAPAYRTIVPQGSVSAIQDLFRTPANYPGAITFTSSSSAINLIALLQASGLTLPPEIPRISIGPITTQTLRDLNFPPHAEAAEPTVPALVASVLQSLTPKPSSL